MGTAFIIPYAVVVAILLYAILKGGGPERAMAAASIVGMGIDQVYHVLFEGPQFSDFQTIHFVIDFLLLAFAVVLSLNANRLWTLVSAASMLIAVLGHANPLLNMDGMQLALWAVTQLPFYIVVLSILLGTISYRKRRKMSLPVRDWRMRQIRA